MNYADMSDLQVNVSVASRLGVNAKVEDGLLFTSKIHDGENVISVTTVTDYCNNPSDAWPIIVENKIGITFVNGEWRASSVAAGYHEFSNINALRAVCCCFLLMNNVDISA